MSQYAKVYHAELWGRRDQKYATLLNEDITTTHWTPLAPTPPYYFFVPRDERRRSEYESGWKITDIMPVNTTGIVTARDKFVIDFEDESIKQRIKTFLREGLGDNEVKERLGLSENYAWRVAEARRQLRKVKRRDRLLTSILYRPFDVRRILYHASVVWRVRNKVMRHMLAGENEALITTRQTRDEWGCMAARGICGHKSCGAYDINTLFPLYLYPDPQKEGDLFDNGTRRHVNFDPRFVRDMEKRLRLSFVADGTGDLKKTFGPEDVFHYIYAVLHSPTYRERYAEFLRIDFPRVPMTGDKKLFRVLCSKGRDLVALHLLDSPKLSTSITRYPVPGDSLVAKGHPRYLPPGESEPRTGKPLNKGRVYISPDAPTSGTKGQYFEGVPPEVWEFHVGGYQVCEKWLKDRRGRKLSYDDLTHYQKVVVALHETIRLMQLVDACIPDWPIR